MPYRDQHVKVQSLPRYISEESKINQPGKCQYVVYALNISITLMYV